MSSNTNSTGSKAKYKPECLNYCLFDIAINSFSHHLNSENNIRLNHTKSKHSRLHEDNIIDNTLKFTRRSIFCRT